MPSHEYVPDDVSTDAEAIVVIDIIGSTEKSDRFGWDTVGRMLMRALRDLTKDIGHEFGLRCRKSTGDGYLLAYGDKQAAEVGAVNALRASFALLQRLAERNAAPDLPEQQALDVRCAVHFGQVDAVHFGHTDPLAGDREGLVVTLAFRLEAIRSSDLEKFSSPIPADQFPQKNYILCSQRVKNIIRVVPQ